MPSVLETLRAPAVTVGGGAVGVTLIGVLIGVLSGRPVDVDREVIVSVGVTRGVACPFTAAKRMNTTNVRTNTPPVTNVWGRLSRQRLFRIAWATAQRSRASRP